MYAASEEIDSITVFAKLHESQELRRVGGAPYLSDLLQAFKQVQNVAAYAEIVVKQWQLRQLKALSDRFAVLHDTADSDEIPQALEQARTFLDEVDEHQEDHTLDFRGLYEAWEEDQEDERPPFSTPFFSLDDMLNGGLRRKRQYIIAARPGCGKTILCAQLAISAARSGHKVLFFSLELGREDIAGRIIACGAQANYSEITRKSLTAETHAKVAQWTAAAAEMPLSVDDSGDITIEEITQRCRAHKQRHGLDMVFIDYIGLVQASKGDSRVLEVDHIAARARAIAKNLDVAVVLASQLNRKIEDHGGRPRLPVMSDLRESGGIEQTADCVMILSRMPDDNGEEANQLPLMACSVVKNRTGTTGTFELAERFDQARFDNAS